jgi:ABC-type transport system involved in multi-copper enzyme maturation permease subunit
MLSLLGRTFQRSLTLLGALTALLVTFQLAIVALATSLNANGGFERIASLVPGFMQEAFAPALMSFHGMVSIAFIEPLIVILIVQFTIYIASEPAGDVESGLVDLILARAVPRARLVTRSLIAMSVAAAWFPVLIAICLRATLEWIAPRQIAWPSAVMIGRLMAELAALAWCFGGLGLAAAAWSRRRGSVQALVGVSAVALYLVEMIASAWLRARWAGWLSPFHYYGASAILAGRTTFGRDVVILASIGAVAIAVAYWRFARRDL